MRSVFDRINVTVSALVAAVLLFLIVYIAHATGTLATLTWTAPTQYVDGTTLAPSEIAFYTVTYPKGPSNVSVIVNPPATSTQITVPCGSTNFTVTVTTTAAATYPNSTSGGSNQVPYATNVQCVPKAPSNLTVS